MKKTVSILGGDLRQVYLAQQLLEEGWDVATWGLEGGGGPAGVPLDRALGRDILLLPMPPVGPDGQLCLPLTDSTLAAEDLWPRLRADQLLLGGRIGGLGQRLMETYGLTLLDYYSREEVQVANAVPTAEGAIQRAMEATAGTIWGSKCLVLGFGRIGKVLAHRLQGLGARVTVAARRPEDLAWAWAYGYDCLPVKDIDGALGAFQLIFNTAPAPLLDARRLEQVGEQCLVVELASAPGGVDERAAESLGRQVLMARGLPGQVAPRAAAAAIRLGVFHILEERGELS